MECNRDEQEFIRKLHSLNKGYGSFARHEELIFITVPLRTTEYFLLVNFQQTFLPYLPQF